MRLFHGVGVGGGEPSASCLRLRTHGIGASGTYWMVEYLAGCEEESFHPLCCSFRALIMTNL